MYNDAVTTEVAMPSLIQLLFYIKRTQGKMYLAQGKMYLAQGKLRENTGNLISAGMWPP